MDLIIEGLKKAIHMSTIKQDRKDLEMLLNGVDPISAPSAVPRPQQTVDNTSDTALPVEHIFDYDYEGSRKRLRKKRTEKTFSVTNS